MEADCFGFGILIFRNEAISWVFLRLGTRKCDLWALAGGVVAESRRVVMTT
jgi:hypothetical protein